MSSPPFAFSCRRRFAFVLAMPLVALIAGAPQSVCGDQAAESDDGGFTSLLEDAKKTWTGYKGKGWPEGWQVEDGVLHCESGGGDLMTVNDYADFDLQFEWKISPRGNSGVIYHVDPKENAPYHTGPEYQVLDSSKHADGKSPLTSAGAIYALYPPKENVERPAGEWNTGRIVVHGGKVAHYLNGKKVATAEIGGDEWNKKVKGSKFAMWKRFGTLPKGRIVLQDHGDEVWYRNVKIKPLKSSD